MITKFFETLFKQKYPKNGNGNFNCQGVQQPNENLPSTSQGGNQNREQLNNSKLTSVAVQQLRPVDPQAPVPKNDPPPAVVASPSQQEIEFDEQFCKWEEEFDKWKQANVNHPDKNAYRQYVQQFETVRVQLLQVSLCCHLV